MTARDRLNVALAAVLATLAEAPDGEAPQGIVAAALLHQEVPFETIRAVLVGGGLVECEGNVMRITERGRAIAGKINEADRRRAERSSGTA
jgi:hypothetical protein